jgi:hypothetical protein
MGRTLTARAMTMCAILEACCCLPAVAQSVSVVRGTPNCYDRDHESGGLARARGTKYEEGLLEAGPNEPEAVGCKRDGDGP